MAIVTVDNVRYKTKVIWLELHELALTQPLQPARNTLAPDWQEEAEFLVTPVCAPLLVWTLN